MLQAQLHLPLIKRDSICSIFPRIPPGGKDNDRVKNSSTAKVKINGRPLTFSLFYRNEIPGRFVSMYQVHPVINKQVVIIYEGEKSVMPSFLDVPAFPLFPAERRENRAGSLNWIRIRPWLTFRHELSGEAKWKRVPIAARGNVTE